MVKIMESEVGRASWLEGLVGDGQASTGGEGVEVAHTCIVVQASIWITSEREGIYSLTAYRWLARGNCVTLWLDEDKDEVVELRDRRRLCIHLVFLTVLLGGSVQHKKKIQMFEVVICWCLIDFPILDGYARLRLVVSVRSVCSECTANSHRWQKSSTSPLSDESVPANTHDCESTAARLSFCHFPRTCY